MKPIHTHNVPWLIPLGSGRAASAGVGHKGALLDRARGAGLSVPDGCILLDVAWQQMVHQGLVVVNNETVSAPDARRLLSALHLPALPASLAVRSAFAVEDGTQTSLAGLFTSRLRVASTDVRQLAAALCEVWASGLRSSGPCRRDVILMAMVPAQHAGVAFTEREFEDDLINVTAGTAERLVAGTVPGETLHTPKLRPWERRTAAALPAPWAARLQRLLRNVRGVFGAGNWDIEWADDGQTCWLVQIRPITRPTRRNEAFTSANFKEILPDLPSRFTTSLIASCADGLFQYYRAFDTDLPTQRLLIDVFYGRPLFNFSLLNDMMRAWGLPTRLITNAIGGENNNDYPLNIGRALRKAPVLSRFALAQLGASTASRRVLSTLLERTERPGQTFSACIDTLRWLYTTVVTEMLALTAAMSVPLLLLRRTGTLSEHNARQRTISTAMFAKLDDLRALVQEHPEIRTVLERGDMPAAPAFQTAWAQFLATHGHRGVYESDIARLRFYEAPQDVLISLSRPTGARQQPPHRTWRGWLTWPIWWQAGRAMRAREEMRYGAMMGFDRIRQALLDLAQQAVERGQLATPDDLWLLDITEVRRLDIGWQPRADFLTQRRHEIAQWQQYDLPDLLHRFDVLEPARPVATASSSSACLTGIGLTTGDVQGQAWVLTEPHTRLPEGFTPETTILVARSIDAGWIPTFACVAGVVVEMGGDLSHGSIILREIGLPAITNARQATRVFRTGEPLILRAGLGVVEHPPAVQAVVSNPTSAQVSK